MDPLFVARDMLPLLGHTVHLLIFDMEGVTFPASSLFLEIVPATVLTAPLISLDVLLHTIAILAKVAVLMIDRFTFLAIPMAGKSKVLFSFEISYST